MHYIPCMYLLYFLIFTLTIKDMMNFLAISHLELDSRHHYFVLTDTVDNPKAQPLTWSIIYDQSLQIST